MKYLTLSSENRNVIRIVFAAVPQVSPDELVVNYEIIRELRLDSIPGQIVELTDGEKKVQHDIGPSKSDYGVYSLSNAAYDALVNLFRVYAKFKGDVEKQKLAADAWMRILRPEQESVGMLNEQIQKLELEIDSKDDEIAMLGDEALDLREKLAAADQKFAEATETGRKRVMELEGRIRELEDRLDDEFDELKERSDDLAEQRFADEDKPLTEAEVEAIKEHEAKIAAIAAHVMGEDEDDSLTAKKHLVGHWPIDPKSGQITVNHVEPRVLSDAEIAIKSALIKEQADAMKPEPPPAPLP